MTAGGLRLISQQVEEWKDFALNPKQRIPFGLREVDKAVLGPAEGEVFTVVARSFVGKSLLATNIMANNPDEAILFFSLEMPAHQCLSRLYSHVFGTPNRDVVHAVSNQRIPQAVDGLAERLPNQAIVDTTAATLDDMSEYMKRYDETFGFRPDLVIVDYLEEVGGAKQSGDGWLRTEATASMMKAWAREERVGVVSLHQANQKTEPWEPPHNGSAKGGGFTESDVVIGLWRPGWDPDLGDTSARRMEHHMYANIIKNRVLGERKSQIRLAIDPALRLKQLRYENRDEEPDAEQVIGAAMRAAGEADAD